MLRAISLRNWDLAIGLKDKLGADPDIRRKQGKKFENLFENTVWKYCMKSCSNTSG